MPVLHDPDLVFGRVRRAVENVERRLRTAAGVLTAAGIPYALVGGNAVAVWVATRDEAAVRNTRDVDVMIRRDDLDRVAEALAAHGFVRRHVAGMDVFLDGPDGKVRDAVRIVFAGEFVRPHEPGPNPDLSDAVPIGETMVIHLESLVRIKLTAWRPKDQVHVADLIDVGLVDASWPDRLPAALTERLRQALADA
jgi:hypothetical protein